MLNLKRTLFSSITLSVFIASAAFAQQTDCSNEEVARAAAQVNAARITLLDLPVPDDLDVGISAKAQPAIVELKNRLYDLIVAYMRCAMADIDLPTIERDLTALQNASILEGRPTKKSEYFDRPLYGHGELLEFHAQRAADGHSVIGITASFSIRCGSDSVLIVFGREWDVWKEVLRWQAQPYNDVDGAFWSFDFSISPPDEYGRWFVATKNITPWCTSNWRMVRYSILRPQPNSVEPRIAFSRRDSIYVGGEEYGTLWTAKDLFGLEFISSSIDVEVHSRPWIRRFMVTGEEVKRIQPVAESPLDFADEWIVSPWAEAAEWSARDRLNDLKNMHVRLDKKGNFFDYVSIRRCAGPPTRHEIHLRSDENGSFYFDVLGGPDFTMKDVRSTAAPDCQGTPQPIK